MTTLLGGREDFCTLVRQEIFLGSVINIHQPNWRTEVMLDRCRQHDEYQCHCAGFIQCDFGCRAWKYRDVEGSVGGSLVLSVVAICYTDPR